MGGSNSKTHPNQPLTQISPRLGQDPSPEINETTNLHRDDKHYGTPFRHEPNFQGPVKNRKCTDVLCLFLFLLFLGGWSFVAYIGITQGDIDKVIFPTDSEGRICGRGELKDRRVLLFFDLTKCLNPAVLMTGCMTPQVCVAKCPDTATNGYALARQPGGGPLAKRVMKPFCKTTITSNEWYLKSASQLIDQDLCPAWTLPSSAFLGRCIPSLIDLNIEKDQNVTVISGDTTKDKKPIKSRTLIRAVTQLGAFLNVRNFGERVFNDISDTWWMIGVGLVTACVLSFVWIVLMRFIAGIMVWTSIGLIFILVGGLFAYSLYQYMDTKDITASQGSIFTVNFTPDYFKDVFSLSDTWLAFTVILGIILLIITLVLIALRQRILIAIELIEQGSKAVAKMCTTLIFPIFPFLLQVVIVAWFMAIALYLSSAGTAEYRVASNSDYNGQVDDNCNCFNSKTNTTYRMEDLCDPVEFKRTCDFSLCPNIICQFVKYIKSNDASWMQWYNLFGLFWALNFVSALSELILAGVFATWYWTRDKSKVPSFTLARSIGRSMFHLGTVAFGSLIIGIIQFIRAIVSYIEKKLRAHNNDLTKCLLCLCKCCLWALEKFMKFINRNAYIMCAMNSTNFCVSAKDAFNLLMRNILRVMVLNKVVDFLLFLGQLVIVAGVGTLSYFVFSGGIPELKDSVPTLNYYFTPIVCIVVGSYIIASSFFGVYSMAVDTLFLCFLEDLERNDGTEGRRYFMSRGLQKVIGKIQKIQDDQMQMR